MKKRMLLTAGVLIGIGSVYGAFHWFAPATAAPGTVKPHTEYPTTLQSAKSISVETTPPEGPLATKIERLQRWACGREPSLNREGATKILTEWSEQDAQAALDFVMTAPHFPRRNFAYAIPLAQICQKDPKKAIAWLMREITEANDRRMITSSVVQRIESIAPVAALELIVSSETATDSDDFGDLLGRVARTQPQAALQALAQKSPDSQKQAIGPMLYQWAQTNPNEALTWYLAMGEMEGNAAQSLASGCIKSGRYTLADLLPRLRLDPAKADGLLFRLSRDGVALDSKTIGLFSERARRRAADFMARNLEDSPERTVAFIKMAVAQNHQAEALLDGWRSWLYSDRKAALDWLGQLPDRQLASELPARLERQEQLQDPHKALAVAATIANLEERKSVVMDAVQRLAWEQPAEVAAWLIQNPTDTPHPGIYGMLTTRYLERDDAGAMAWISRLGAGEARDTALSAAAMFWAEKEIEFATTSMAVIGDAQKRQQCMFNLYKNLNRTDAAKADQWLACQGLSAEVRQSWKTLGQTSGRAYVD